MHLCSYMPSGFVSPSPYAGGFESPSAYETGEFFSINLVDFYIQRLKLCS
jgi:hypothetical protein